MCVTSLSITKENVTFSIMVLNLVMLSVAKKPIMLSVITMNVVAPFTIAIALTIEG
jgi:hypothetical protein